MGTSMWEQLTKNVPASETTIIRVLFVDGEVGFLKVAKQMLELQGQFRVQTASSVKEALEKISEETFDVIVSDCQMPEEDCLDFLTTLRKNSNTTPFIIFTEKGREEVAIKALNLGAYRYFNKTGRPETVYGELAHGIRQAATQRRAELEIWNREERLRAIIASSPDAMIVTDIHGKITDCNLETLKLLDFSKRDIIGKDYYELLVKDDRKKVVDSAKELLEKGTVTDLKCRLLAKNGDEIPVEYSANILSDAFSNFVGAVSLARNITERENAERKLAAGKILLKAILENVGVMLAYFDRNFNFVAVNSVYAKGSGHTVEELIGKNHFELFPNAENQAIFERVRETGETVTFLDKPFEYADQPEREVTYWDWTLAPIKDETGQTEGLLLSLFETTQRKRMEQELKESEEKYRIMVEQAPDAIFRFDLNGTVTSCNLASLAITGFSEKELVGKLFPEFVPLVDSSKELFGLYDFLFSGGVPEPFEVRFQTKNGDYFFGEVHTSLLKEGEKITGFQAIVRDTSERKKAEEALRESEKRFRELSELLPEIIFEADSKGVLTFVNRESYSKFGYSTEEFEKGLTALQMIAPIDRDRAKENIAKLLHGEVLGPNEYKAIRKDGYIFPIIVNTSPIIHENKVVGFRGVMVDLTEHMETEDKLKETLKNMETLNEKLSVVGKLTRHDTLNKISVIINNIYLAKQQLKGNKSASEYLDNVESAIEQVEKIFAFARIYEKLGTEKLTSVNVKKSVDEAFTLISGSNEIKLVNECEGLSVLADSLLRQVFYNLIDDSLKHGEKVTQIKVYYKKEKESLKLIYEDDGVGIPEDEKEKIFREGYGKGTGYGLYLIKKSLPYTVGQYKKQANRAKEPNSP